MSINIPLRLPEYHGDHHKYPKESWKQYKFNLELAYKVAGVKNISDEQKAAHLLQGLQGKARSYLELNPELMTQSLKEVEKALELQFGRSRAQGLPDLNAIVQKPNESVSEYAARMKTAAMPMSDEKRSVQIMTEQEIRDKDIDRTIVQVWTPEEYARELRIIKESTDRFVCPYFIKGLRKTIQDAIIPQRPETLEDAIKLATEHERYAQMYGRTETPEVNMVEAQAAPSKNRNSKKNDYGDEEVINKVSKHLKKLNKDSDDPSAPNDRYRNPGNRPDNRVATTGTGPTCHYCGQVGHFSRQCPVKKYHEQQARQDNYLNGKRSGGAFMQRGMRDMLPAGPGHSYPATGQPGKNAYTQNSKNGEHPPQGGDTRVGIRFPAPFIRQNPPPEGRRANQQ